MSHAHRLWFYVPELRPTGFAHAALLALALVAVSHLTAPVHAQGQVVKGPVQAPAPEAPPKAVAVGQVMGRIVGAAAKEAAGARVVLVKFTLNAEGVPQGAPIQMQNADGDGRFSFSGVPMDTQAVYKLGSRIAGRLVASEPFTFPEGQPMVQVNLSLPGLVSDTAGLFLKQALVAFEPAVGSVWITEVMHVGNPTPNVIDIGNAPIELTLPSDASELTMIREEQEAPTHTHLGPKLLVYGRLKPGDTTIAFRYRSGAALGTVQVEKRYPLAVEELLVITPKGALRLASEQLSPQQPQQFEGVTYDAWGSQNVPAQRRVVVNAQGVPVRQELFLIPVAGFFVAMGGVLWWFLRKRLAREQMAA